MSTAILLEDTQMTTTFIGIMITAIAIKIDQLTNYRHYVLPLVALAGLLTIVVSLLLQA